MQDPISGTLEEKLTRQDLGRMADGSFSAPLLVAELPSEIKVRREETKIPDYDVSWQEIQTVHKLHL